MPHSSIWLSTALIAVIVPVATAADVADAPAADIWEALSKGTTHLDTRLRFEAVDEDAFDDNSQALLVDIELSYQTGTFHDFSALIEAEYVAPLTDDDDFRSPTNGTTNRPLIADPEGAEINRLWLQYQPEALTDTPTTIKLGRQWVRLDNQRHVGTVSWRLNEQTFDALSVVSQPIESLTVVGAYVWSVNSILGTNIPMDSAIILNGSYELEGFGAATAYAYLLDFAATGARDTSTVGVRFSGDRDINDDFTVLYEAELAQQNDYADTDNISCSYMHVSAGIRFQDYTAKIGYEVLGSDDGNTAYQTPIGTKHKFNGYADKFLTTPNDGLVDLNIKLSAEFPDQVPGLKLGLHYHTFEGDKSGDSFGDEIDLLATYKWDHGVSFGAKYANYSADEFASDTSKLWLWTAWGF